MDYELSVALHDLRAGLAKFRTRRTVRASDKAILGFDGRFFSIEAMDNVFACNAVGVWPGIATIGATAIIALAAVPPKIDPVMVKVSGDRLRIGSLTVSCKWQPVSHTLMKLPSAPDWIETLSLKYRATRAQLSTDGWDKEISAAEHNLEKLIRRVGKSLAVFGITEGDLRNLIDQRMTERYASRPSRSS